MSSFEARLQKAKTKSSNYRGGQDSHKFERIMYLKNTAQEFSLNHKDMLKRIRENKFDCPMGWIRAQMGVSQVVTSVEG